MENSKTLLEEAQGKIFTLEGELINIQKDISSSLRYIIFGYISIIRDKILEENKRALVAQNEALSYLRKELINHLNEMICIDADNTSAINKKILAIKSKNLISQNTLRYFEMTVSFLEKNKGKNFTLVSCKEKIYRMRKKSQERLDAQFGFDYIVEDHAPIVSMGGDKYWSPYLEENEFLVREEKYNYYVCDWFHTDICILSEFISEEEFRNKKITTTESIPLGDRNHGDYLSFMAYTIKPQSV